eukprot:gene490-biopygen410
MPLLSTDDKIEGGEPDEELPSSAPPQGTQVPPHGPEAFDPFPGAEDLSLSVRSFSIDDAVDDAPRPTEQEDRYNARDALQETLGIPSVEWDRAHARGIAHHLASTALLNIGDGKKRSLNLNSIGMRSYSLKRRMGSEAPSNVAQAMEEQHATIHRWGVRIDPQLMERGAVYVAAEEGRTLPESIGRLRFVAGTHPVVVTLKAKMLHSFCVTTNSAIATVGVYLPGGVNYVYPEQRTQEDGVRHARQSDNSEESTQRLSQSRPTAAQPRQSTGGGVKIKDELNEILGVVPKRHLNPLNRPGSPEWGRNDCPRGWGLEPQRPPHVSGVAWAALTEATRQKHLVVHASAT